MSGRSILAYVPVNLATIVTSFGGLAILTRLLDASEYGRYALAMITMLAFHMALFSWLEAAMARFQARAERNDDVNSHVKTLYRYALLTVAIIWPIAMAVLFVLPIDASMRNVLAVAISSTCLQLFLNIGTEAHKAAHRIMRYSALYSTHLMLSFTIGIILIIVTPLREMALFFGIMAAIIIVLSVDLPFMIKQMRGGTSDPDKVKTYFKYGMPISVSLLLTYALSSGDMYLITAMLGDAYAGEYSASYNLANRSLDVLFIWLGMAFTPIAVTALEKQGLDQSRDVMKDYGAALLWIAMPAATGIALVAGDVGFILGEDVRAGAVKIMPLIAFAGVLNGMICYYAQRAFMLSGKTDMFVWAMVPPVILNIGLNIVLIPKYELMGAVYATVAAYALGLVIAMVLGRRHYPLPVPVRAFFEISLACIAMAATVWALGPLDSLPDFIALLIKATLGAVTYGIVCLVINAANCRDLLRDMIGRFKSKDDADIEPITAEVTP
ncbi:polysaccharide biosynthesis C-terminal domain-containing protein [Fretibacter rubidus]|uniref:oligosaccharide flippase family protein n=1 Tax=Fretibacter rubidus TaxID=570162 RepID=UPI00352B094A